MDQNIRDLKNKVIEAIQENDRGALLSSLPKDFIQIASFLGAEITPEKNLLRLKLYFKDIEDLKKIRRMNDLFEVRTRIPYTYLVQTYHLALFESSIKELLRINKHPKYNQMREISEDIEFLVEHAKEVLPKEAHAKINSIAAGAKNTLAERLSSVDRVLNRFWKRKSAYLLTQQRTN